MPVMFSPSQRAQSVDDSPGSKRRANAPPPSGHRKLARNGPPPGPCGAEAARPAHPEAAPRLPQRRTAASGDTAWNERARQTQAMPRGASGRSGGRCAGEPGAPAGSPRRVRKAAGERRDRRGGRRAPGGRGLPGGGPGPGGSHWQTGWQRRRRGARRARPRGRHAA